MCKFQTIYLAVRYIVEKPKVKQFENPSYNVIDHFQVMPGRDLFLYYPNNDFIRRLVTQAHNVIKSRKPWLTATIQGTDSADISALNKTTIDRLIVFASFPSNYTFYLPKQIKYTLHTQEQNSFEYHIESTLYDTNEYMFGKSPENLCTSIILIFKIYIK